MPIKRTTVLPKLLLESLFVPKNWQFNCWNMTFAFQLLSYFASSNHFLIIDYLVDLKVIEKMTLTSFVLEILKAEKHLSSWWVSATTCHALTTGHSINMEPTDPVHQRFLTRTDQQQCSLSLVWRASLVSTTICVFYIFTFWLIVCKLW